MLAPKRAFQALGRPPTTTISYRTTFSAQLTSPGCRWFHGNTPCPNRAHHHPLLSSSSSSQRAGGDAAVTRAIEWAWAPQVVRSAGRLNVVREQARSVRHCVAVAGVPAKGLVQDHVQRGLIAAVAMAIQTGAALALAVPARRPLRRDAARQTHARDPCPDDALGQPIFRVDADARGNHGGVFARVVPDARVPDDVACDTWLTEYLVWYGMVWYGRGL